MFNNILEKLQEKKLLFLKTKVVLRKKKLLRKKLLKKKLQKKRPKKNPPNKLRLQKKLLNLPKKMLRLKKRRIRLMPQPEIFSTRWIQIPTAVLNSQNLTLT